MAVCTVIQYQKFVQNKKSQLCQFRHTKNAEIVTDKNSSTNDNWDETFLDNSKTTTGSILKDTKKLISCEFCDFVTDQNNTFTQHVRDNHELSCDKCDTHFVTRESLDLHVKFKHVENKFNCKVCQVDFREEDSLLEHIKEKHEIKEHLNIKHKETNIEHKETFKKFLCV